MKIKEAKARLDKGEIFKDVAVEYNKEDMSDKRNGEQVFDHTTARMDMQINQKMKEEAGKLLVGQTSDVIEAGNAFYIIKCIDRSIGGYKPYQEVKDNVRSLCIDIKYDSLVDKLVKNAKIIVNEEAYSKIEVD